MTTPLLDPQARGLLEAARTAVLATVAPDGQPRLVPVCFAVVGADGPRPVLWTPLDQKPKQVRDPLRLARARDIAERPRVSLLVQAWDEDWSRLAWLRLSGLADVITPPGAGEDPDGREGQRAIAALRARYPQYAAQDLEGRPLVRVRLDRARRWSALEGTDPRAGA